ncbi:hypothetical protein FRC07_010651, partial [Ceratobasidium sp. 392]
AISAIYGCILSFLPAGTSIGSLQKPVSRPENLVPASHPVPVPVPAPAPVPTLFQAPVPLQAAASYQTPASLSVPVSARIPVFPPAPEPMAIDCFKPKRPRSPVLPPAPTSTYVHGPRVTEGQLIRTRLDFQDMTLSLEPRDVSMREPGMGDMDTDLPEPPRQVVGLGHMDTSKSRRAWNPDVEMASPFDEDVDMESADTMMDWDAAAMAY